MSEVGSGGGEGETDVHVPPVHIVYSVHECEVCL